MLGLTRQGVLGRGFRLREGPSQTLVSRGTRGPASMGTRWVWDAAEGRGSALRGFSLKVDGAGYHARQHSSEIVARRAKD